MIFGKQLCQSYQKLAQLSRTHFVFIRNHSTAEKLNFQWHANFGFIEFFLEISIFSCCVWPLCQNDRAEHFFSGLEKNQTFSHFFMCWGGKNQSDFFHEAKQIPTGPPLKNDDEPKFSLFVNPPIFSLENQFYKISHYTVNKYQGSSNFWTVWPILKIQNAK